MRWKCNERVLSVGTAADRGVGAGAPRVSLHDIINCLLVVVLQLELCGCRLFQAAPAEGLLRQSLEDDIVRSSCAGRVDAAVGAAVARRLYTLHGRSLLLLLVCCLLLLLVVVLLLLLLLVQLLLVRSKRHRGRMQLSVHACSPSSDYRTTSSSAGVLFEY